MNKAEKNDNDYVKKHLFVTQEKEYGDKYKSHLLEQYKLCVLMADKNSSRRVDANNFFLSLNTLLIAIIGILSRLGPSFIAFYLWWTIIASFAGILFCWIWRINIGCYRALSEAKFKVINVIEQKLPVVAFETEWKYLNPESKDSKYPQLTKVERWIPLIFTALYLALIMIALTLASPTFFGGDP
jgi:hypothetical protein